MLLYINLFFSNYLPAEELFTIVYVFLVAISFGLCWLYKRLKKYVGLTDLNDEKLHSMDNYTFNFENTEVAIASSDKKIGVVTKMMVWSLIVLFVAIPFYSIIPNLGYMNNYNYGFMICFPGLLQ